MKQRLFIALDPTEDLRQEIVDLQSRLEKLRLPVLFQPAEKLHLTLNFLGAVDESAVGNLGAAVRTATSGISSFSLTPAFLETLYQKHDNSIIYLGFSGDISHLKNLQSELKKYLADLHFAQPKRFLPHITIGKFKKTDPVLTKSYMDQIRDFDFYPLSAFIIDHVILYESLLSKAGSHFRRLRRFPLTA